MARRNLKVIISYCGTNYHGWAIQKEVATVEGTILEAFSKLVKTKVRICGTSRTDAGVHARGQVANINLDSPIPTENIKHAINQILPDDIAFVSVEDAPRGFDPIGGPIDKHYQYKIYTGKDKDVFEVGKYWHYPYSLDEKKMQQAADRFVGTKDFRAFASAKDTRTNSIRTIIECNVNRDGDWIIIDVRGNKFMYNMVRNMVGTLIEVGRCRWEPDCIDDILKSRDRRNAGMLAPPDGLYLMHINFGD